MWTPTFFVFVAHAAIFSSYIILQRHRPTATLAWILAVIFIPVGGLAAWFVLGRRRVRRRTVSRQSVSAALRSRVPAPELRFHTTPRTGGDDDRSPALHLMQLGRATSRSPVTHSNRVTLFTRPHAAYGALEHAIRGAQNHVHLLYYIFRGDAVGRRIRDALIERAKAGVKVRCLFDGLGSIGLTDEFVRPLHEVGAEVAWFLPVRLRLLSRTGPARPDLRNHRKIVVVDGNRGFTGGLNVGVEYAGSDDEPGWRDTHLGLEGPAAWELQRIFVEDWLYATGQEIDLDPLFTPITARGDDRVQIMASGPDCDWQIIHTLYFQAIASACKRVYLTTPYFVPDDSILMALTTAALRGVDVRLLLPQKSDVRLVLWAGRSYYRELLDAGVRIYEYRPRVLHAKTLVIDGEVASIGSANMDIRSFELNFEANAFIYGRRVAEQLEAAFFADVAQSEPILRHRQQHRALGWRLAEGWARLLSPLL